VFTREHGWLVFEGTCITKIVPEVFEQDEPDEARWHIASIGRLRVGSGSSARPGSTRAEREARHRP
jgi:hypothetical protein